MRTRLWRIWMILTSPIRVMFNRLRPERPLGERHVKNCRVLVNRMALLEQMPKNAVCAEIGIERGMFSEQILKITKPATLHLIDFSSSFIKMARDKFVTEIKDGRVITHNGMSHTEMARFPDKYFDWIYIDANHEYGHVKRDLEISRHKVKDDGWLVFNDYIFYDHILKVPFGVIQAVNELCLDEGYEVLYFAFNHHMFADVALKKVVAAKS